MVSTGVAQVDHPFQHHMWPTPKESVQHLHTDNLAETHLAHPCQPGICPHPSWEGLCRRSGPERPGADRTGRTDGYVSKNGNPGIPGAGKGLKDTEVTKITKIAVTSIGATDRRPKPVCTSSRV